MMGKANLQYEKSFSDRFGVLGSFSFWKGRVALYAILKALGVRANDEVIFPGYTCVVNVNPVKYCGARPVYVDIEPNTFTMNVDLLEEKITANTRVIIAQHTYGYPCDMDAVMEIAVRRGLAVVEDCCLAFGSKYKGRTVGTFGKAAYFSFQWNKPYTTGLGGMVISNDRELSRKIAELRRNEMCSPGTKEAAMLAAQLVVYRMFIFPRTTALAQNMFRYLAKKGVVVGSYSTTELEPKIANDFFKAMSSVQARSGLRKLGTIDSNISHRRDMAQLYDRLLLEKGWPVRQYNGSIVDPVMVRYPVRIIEKDRALEGAAKAGVELGSWFECPLHPIETPLTAYDYEMGTCPEAEKASMEVVNLPLHPRVSEKTVRKTVAFATKFTQAG